MTETKYSFRLSEDDSTPFKLYSTYEEAVDAAMEYVDTPDDFRKVLVGPIITDKPERYFPYINDIEETISDVISNMLGTLIKDNPQTLDEIFDRLIEETSECFSDSVYEGKVELLVPKEEAKQALLTILTKHLIMGVSRVWDDSACEAFEEWADKHIYLDPERYIENTPIRCRIAAINADINLTFRFDAHSWDWWAKSPNTNTSGNAKTYSAALAEARRAIGVA